MELRQIEPIQYDLERLGFIDIEALEEQNYGTNHTK
jgi:hypothetical protein